MHFAVKIHAFCLGDSRTKLYIVKEHLSFIRFESLTFQALNFCLSTFTRYHFPVITFNHLINFENVCNALRTAHK